jgi:hypothetical protein
MLNEKQTKATCLNYLFKGTSRGKASFLDAYSAGFFFLGVA